MSGMPFALVNHCTSICRTPLLLLCCLLFTPFDSHAATWAEDALIRESGYIVNCSFTEFAVNHSAVQTTDDAYGAINVDRIFQSGPDWVNPGESAMAAIGLMAAARQLKLDGFSISTYDQALNRFFQTWLLARKQSVNTNALDSNYGGIYSRVYYDSSGLWRSNDAPTTAVTGQMLAAMWKYYEYNVSISNTITASNWLQQSWDIARTAGDFIRRMTNATYKLVRGNASGSDLWISDSAMSVAGLRCLDQWAITAGKAKAFDYGALADAIVIGLQGLKDNSTRKNFFKYRSSGGAMPPLTATASTSFAFSPTKPRSSIPSSRSADPSPTGGPPAPAEST